MPGKMDKDHPVIQKEIHALVDEAMRARGIDLEDRMRGELLRRADVEYGYRDQPVIRFLDPDKKRLSACDCLDRLLNDTGHSTETPPGPVQIRWSDKEAVLHADPARISRGEIVIVDDREYPH
jgi:hypothetical protein